MAQKFCTNAYRCWRRFLFSLLLREWLLKLSGYAFETNRYNSEVVVECYETAVVDQTSITKRPAVDYRSLTTLVGSRRRFAPGYRSRTTGYQAPNSMHGGMSTDGCGAGGSDLAGLTATLND
jgi:hypothetical protein